MRADHLDDLVDVVVRDLEPFEDVRALPGSAKVVFAAAADDHAAVVDVVLEDLLERERARVLIDEGQHVQVERRLHRGVLVQVVQHERRVVVALDLDDDAHALAVALVADVGDAREALVLDQLGDLLDERRLVHLIRELGDDDRVAVAAKLLVVRLCARDDPSASLRVRPADRVDALGGARLDVALLVEPVDDAAAREVGPDDRVAEVVGREVGLVDETLRRRDDLAEVVRWDVGGHADRDPGGSVDDEVR